MLPLFFLRRHHHYGYGASLLRLLYYRYHPFSTSYPPPEPRPLDLPLSHPIFQIWSANTSLGKTLVSTGLSSSFLLSSSANKKFLYVKPVQTGFPSDSDSRFVYTKLSALYLRHKFPFSLCLSHSVLNSSLSAAKSLLPNEIQIQAEKCSSRIYGLNYREESKILGDDNNNVVCELDCKTLFAWEEAVSPHLAAERESGAVGDSEVVEMLAKCLRDELESERREGMEVFCVVETAGGVASPGPSGSLQCDLYRQVIISILFVIFRVNFNRKSHIM